MTGLDECLAVALAVSDVLLLWAFLRWDDRHMARMTQHFLATEAAR